MDCQRRDLHYVANVEKVKPLALVQVTQEHFHVHGFLQASQFLLTIRHLRLLVEFFLFDHTRLDLFNDGVDAKGRALQHRDRMIIVYQIISLIAHSAVRGSPDCRILLILSFMHLLLKFLGNKRLFNIYFAQGS